MSDPGDTKRRATYQDVLDAPPHKVAEIINGELRLSPRPPGPQLLVASVLGGVLAPPFDFGRDGPGGWLLLNEVELHLGDDIVVPDRSGWRRDRMPIIADDAYITLAPDWICEVLSRFTETMDRAEKLAIYASAGVGHAWLLHPLRRTLEVLRLHDGKWLIVAVHVGDKVVRAEPFDAIELDLSLLWRDIAPRPPRGSRASEPAATYEYDEY